MIPRAISGRYLDTVGACRVTVVMGPRQAGKATLVESNLRGGTIRCLDEQGVLEAARADPAGFLAAGERPVVIDEIQRAGEPLVRAIKAEVDRNRDPGQFVLTGSSNFLTVPTISESLAGRAGFINVWPFTQGELEGSIDGFVDAVFAEPEVLGSLSPKADGRDILIERICRGGYPEVQLLDGRLRADWFRDYVATSIQRDVVEMSGIRRSRDLEQLLRLFGARTACELVMQQVINDAPVDRQAVYSYRSWLETIHLVTTIPAWSRNLTTRVKRHPKVFITDPGLAAWLIGKSPAGLADDPVLGQLVETFVFTELLRQLTWSQTEASIFHWRNRDGAEIDLILEAADGSVVGIEVKAGATASESWFRWLKKMRSTMEGQFRAGIALYSGSEVLPFGDRLYAVPISTLWQLSR